MHDPQDDYAGMVSDLRGRMDERALRFALAVSDDRLAEIEAGYVPDDETAERIRTLDRLSRSADLDEPESVLRALGDGESGSPPALALGLLARRRKLIVGFVVVDVLFVAGALVVVLLLD